MGRAADRVRDTPGQSLLRASFPSGAKPESPILAGATLRCVPGQPSPTRHRPGSLLQRSTIGRQHAESALRSYLHIDCLDDVTTVSAMVPLIARLRFSGGIGGAALQAVVANLRRTPGH